MATDLVIGRDVPWNASWSGEAARYEVRPCRWAGGRPAVWQAHKPGEGRPLFAEPHMVRQRRCVAEFRCTVCGQPTTHADRVWFPLGEHHGDAFVTTEPPVHRACAQWSAERCPRIRKLATPFVPFPDGWQIVASQVGGDAVERDFGLRIDPKRPVIGALKLVWRM